MTMRYRAILFDVDGTLYRQTLLRGLMAAELVAAPLRRARLTRGVHTARILRTYRHAHEELRALGASDRPLAEDQIARTAAALAIEEAAVRDTVEEWMIRRPLKYLRWCRRQDLLPFLRDLAAAGVRLGVLSDYPPEPKLAALDVDGLFDFTLCTSAEDVNALKPHPRGFEVACRRWSLAPGEVLYVGDRPDVDGRGAAAAGLDCAIIGGARGGTLAIQRFDELRRHVFDAA